MVTEYNLICGSQLGGGNGTLKQNTTHIIHQSNKIIQASIVPRNNLISKHTQITCYVMNKEDANEIRLIIANKKCIGFDDK